jgi:hypothetical protein
MLGLHQKEVHAEVVPAADTTQRNQQTSLLSGSVLSSQEPTRELALQESGGQS